jgi:DNA polymerase III epsilon subunit-like protein
MHYKDERGNRVAWNDAIQPYIAQLAYMIYDRNREEVKRVNIIVNSSLIGCTEIQPGAEAVHGISFERMRDEGQNPHVVAEQLIEDFGNSDYCIAHNKPFDIGILNLHLWRCGMNPNLFEGKHTLCTMMPLTNVLKIPSPNGRGFKWPKLDEAYRALIDSKGFTGAHDAWFDTAACRDIFWKCWDANIIQDPTWKAAKERFNA